MRDTRFVDVETLLDHSSGALALRTLVSACHLLPVEVPQRLVAKPQLMELLVFLIAKKSPSAPNCGRCCRRQVLQAESSVRGGQASQERR